MPCFVIREFVLQVFDGVKGILCMFHIGFSNQEKILTCVRSPRDVIARTMISRRLPKKSSFVETTRVALYILQQTKDWKSEKISMLSVDVGRVLSSK